MATQTMNEYRLTLASARQITAVYATMREAVMAFDSPQSPLTQALLVRTGIEVGIPETPVMVSFRTEIGGAGAADAGCKASPSAFQVLDGTAVIFEATAGDGYNFVGWSVGGVIVNVHQIASIIINAPITISQDVIITAQFAPVVP